MNTIFDELVDTIETNYVFFGDEKNKWNDIRKKYAHLRGFDAGIELFSNLQDMLRMMNDSHLSIHFQSILETIPSAFVTCSGNNFFYYTGSLFERIIRFQGCTVEGIQTCYCEKYPYFSLALINRMILEDFYSNRLLGKNNYTSIETPNHKYSIHQIDRNTYFQRYAAVKPIPSKSLNWQETNITYLHINDLNIPLDVPKLACKKLIIDLRGNLGGHTSKAIEVAGRLLSKDYMIREFYVLTKDCRLQYTIKGRASFPDSMRDTIVLIDDTTMSSAEYILATSLIGGLMGISVGVATPGASGESKSFLINGNIPLTISSKRYLDAKSNMILYKGIRPDYYVANDINGIMHGIDRQLEFAVMLLHDERRN